MSLDAQFDAAAAQWLTTTGVAGTYLPAAGGSVGITVTIEREVQTIDDQGLVIRRSIAFIAKAEVDAPVEGDRIDAYGRIWTLTGFAGSGDHTHEVFVK